MAQCHGARTKSGPRGGGWLSCFVRYRRHAAVKAFFIDSLRNQASTASDHALSDVGNPITVRKLADGRQFRIFKVFYDPVGLEHRLEAAGWSGYVRSTGAYFIYGCVQRP